MAQVMIVMFNRDTPEPAFYSILSPERGKIKAVKGRNRRDSEIRRSSGSQGTRRKDLS
jgi:hypothetical protein